MIVTPYQTRPVVLGDELYPILDEFLLKLEENSVVVITSKIVSITQSRVVENDGTVDKKDLIHKECDYYLEHEAMPRYGFILTIKDNILIANSGIDESNGNGYFVLWPKDLQKTTNEVWKYLRQRDSIHNLGVVVTDSHTMILRWGCTGVGLSWCGFDALNRYIDEPDIFGRKFQSVNASILDGLAASAVTVMGEGKEQTPLAVISDIPFVHFVDHEPTNDEIDALKIALDDDLYAPLLTSVPWKKGGI